MTRTAAAFAELEDALSDGMRCLGEQLSGSRTQTLLAYLSLLSHWSSAYNLTAIREPRAMLHQHLLDCLAAVRFVRGPRVLDVGSGAGLPGFVIAISRPSFHVTLLDSVGKKTRFCEHATATLGLANVEVANGRVERFAPGAPFDTVVARAFGPLAMLYRVGATALGSGGCIVAMKGRLDEAEWRDARDAGATLDTHRVTIPGLDAERHVVVMRRCEEISAP